MTFVVRKYAAGFAAYDCATNSREGDFCRTHHLAQQECDRLNADLEPPDTTCRKCMCCSEMINSTGPHHRLCAHCRRKSDDGLNW